MDEDIASTPAPARPYPPLDDRNAGVTLTGPPRTPPSAAAPRPPAP